MEYFRSICNAANVTRSFHPFIYIYKHTTELSCSTTNRLFSINAHTIMGLLRFFKSKSNQFLSHMAAVHDNDDDDAGRTPWQVRLLCECHRGCSVSVYPLSVVTSLRAERRPFPLSRRARAITRHLRQIIIRRPDFSVINHDNIFFDQEN